MVKKGQMTLKYPILEEQMGKETIYRYSNPKNNQYITLAEGFMFYDWLIKIFKNKLFLKESVVLKFLYENEFDGKEEKLKKFVFHPFKNDDKQEENISQKWHYYIALCLMKEYWGKIGHSKAIENFETATKKDVPFKCEALKEWTETKGKRE